MGKFKKYIALSILMIISAESLAVVECVRPIANIWAGNDSNKIYIIHSDGHGASGMNLASAGNDNDVIDRTLSIILAGHMAGKNVTFRYPAGSSCTPSSTQQFIGAWLN